MSKAVSLYTYPEYPRRVLTPGVVNPKIADIEALARWFDYAFVLPGGFRFGLAGIAGLIPGLGDVFDGLVSLYIVVRAIQLGIPRLAIARMLVNVGIEALAGSIPWIGDLFDVVFKANRRNFLLLQSHVSQPKRQSKDDGVFLILLFGLVLLSIALPLIALFELAKHV